MNAPGISTTVSGGGAASAASCQETKPSIAQYIDELEHRVRGSSSYGDLQLLHHQVSLQSNTIEHLEKLVANQNNTIAILMRGIENGPASLTSRDDFQNDLEDVRQGGQDDFKELLELIDSKVIDLAASNGNALKTTTTMLLDGFQGLFVKVRAEFDAKLEKLESKLAPAASDVNGAASTTPPSDGAVVVSSAPTTAVGIARCFSASSAAACPLDTTSKCEDFSPCAGDFVRLVDLKTACLNRKVGLVVEYNESTQRYGVVLRGALVPKAFRASNLIPYMPE